MFLFLFSTAGDFANAASRGVKTPPRTTCCFPDLWRLLALELPDPGALLCDLGVDGVSVRRSGARLAGWLLVLGRLLRGLPFQTLRFLQIRKTHIEADSTEFEKKKEKNFCIAFFILTSRIQADYLLGTGLVLLLGSGGCHLLLMSIRDVEQHHRVLTS